MLGQGGGVQIPCLYARPAVGSCIRGQLEGEKEGGPKPEINTTIVRPTAALCGAGEPSGAAAAKAIHTYRNERRSAL